VGTGDLPLIAIDARHQQRDMGGHLRASANWHHRRALELQGRILMGYKARMMASAAPLPPMTPRRARKVWRFWTVRAIPSKRFEQKDLEMASKTWLRRRVEDRRQGAAVTPHPSRCSP